MPTPVSPNSKIGGALLGAYGLSVAIAVVRILSSGWRANRIVSSASQLNLPPDVLSSIAEFERKIGVVPPELRHSAMPVAPFTYGHRRPIIVLPDALVDSPNPDLLISVVAHELIHIRRHDFAWNVLVEAIHCLFAFHPAAQFMRRRIRAAREVSCDSCVAATLIDGPRYAEVLLDVALQTAAFAPVAAPSIGTVTSNDLEDRLRTLMSANPGSLQTSFWRALISTFLITGTALVSALYAFEPPDPNQFVGTWRLNWASNLRPEFVVDRDDCCYRTIQVRYSQGLFSGSVITDTVSIEGNRVVRSAHTTALIDNAALENGILRFRHVAGSREEVFEVALGVNNTVLVRSYPGPEPVPAWAPYTRLQ
jgi:beta-lactamase regulating signal transducer with metallopeptidase domain